MSRKNIPIALDHSFNVKIAAEYGINEAIIFKTIYLWVAHNAGQDVNYHDGKYWTYNSKRAMAEHFPYFTERQVKYALDKLRAEGLLEVGNYNKYAKDRTLWYTLTEKGYSLMGTEPFTRDDEEMEAREDWLRWFSPKDNGENKNVQPLDKNVQVNSKVLDKNVQATLDKNVQPLPSTYTNTYNKSSSSSVSSPFPEELFDEDDDGELRSALKGVKDLNSEEMRELVRLKKDHGTKALCETLRTALLHRAKCIVPYVKKLLADIKKQITPKKKREPKKMRFINTELMTNEEYDAYCSEGIIPDREGMISYEYV